MVYLVIVLSGSYLALLIAAVAGWARAIARPLPNAAQSTFLSVVVAARNEAHRLPLLLQDLARQRHTSFEVLVMDDHSEDDTYAVAAGYEKLDTRFRVVRCRGEGKKLAIAQAVAQAGGTIIVTTDADCRVPREWLENMAAAFGDASVQLVFGGVRMASHHFFSAMQAIEFCSLIGSGAASAAFHRPILCNGANLAYRKAAFETVHGYEGNAHIPSGDDEFLMRKVAARFPRSIRFAGSAGAVVETTPCSTLREFVQQRLRWAGKWRHNRSVVARSMAVYVLLVQLTTMACMVSLFVAGGSVMWWAAVFLAAKLLLEGAFLRWVSRFLGVRWNWLAFMVLQLLYPVYVVLIGARSLVGSSRWKGRAV